MTGLTEAAPLMLYTHDGGGGKTLDGHVRALPLRYLPVPLLGFLGAAVTRGFVLPPERLAAVVGTDKTLASLLVYTAWSALALAVTVDALRSQGFSLRDLGWRGRLPPAATGFALLAAAAAAGLYPPVAGFARLLGLPVYWDPARKAFVEPGSALDIALALLLRVALVPAIEETLFRGYLLEAQRARFGLAPALLLHNLVFAGIHLAAGSGLAVYIFVWSFLPGLIWIRYGSVYPCIIMHALNNLFADLVVPLFVIG